MIRSDEDSRLLEACIAIITGGTVAVAMNGGDLPLTIRAQRKIFNALPDVKSEYLKNCAELGLDADEIRKALNQ